MEEKAGFIKQVADGFTDLFFPPFCFHCGTGLFGMLRKSVCDVCMKTIVIQSNQRLEAIDGLNRHVSGVFVIGEYDNTLRDAVHYFKYNGRVPLGKDIIAGFCAVRGDELSAFQADLILYVPLHPLREWKRGFNQSRIIAEEISCFLNVKTLHALNRAKYTRQQVGLGKTERRENVRGAFKLRRKTGNMLSGKKVLLVDDVITTGATLDECTRILVQDGGVKEVGYFAIARR